METTGLELVEGKSSKFWQVELAKGPTRYVVRWGRVGTAGKESALAMLVACGVACTPKPSAPPNRGVYTAPARGSVDPVQPPAPPPRVEPRVRGGAVDDIVVGAAIPPRYLDEKARYEARWVADAQPLEGFLLGNPPVWVTLDKGPMTDVEPGPLETLTPVLAPKALAAARAGALVGGIVVEHPGITTAAGIGVGSSYESLRDAYGEIVLVRNPEWFDSKPTCDAQAKSLPGVRFLLESCKPGDAPGPVKRMLVERIEEP